MTQTLTVESDPDDHHAAAEVTDGREAARFMMERRPSIRVGPAQLIAWHRLDRLAMQSGGWYGSVEAGHTKRGELRWGALRDGRKAKPVGAELDRIAALEPLINWFLGLEAQGLRAGEYTVTDAPLWCIRDAAALDGQAYTDPPRANPLGGERAPALQLVPVWHADPRGRRWRLMRGGFGVGSYIETRSARYSVPRTQTLELHLRDNSDVALYRLLRPDGSVQHARVDVHAPRAVNRSTVLLRPVRLMPARRAAVLAQLEPILDWFQSATPAAHEQDVPHSTPDFPLDALETLERFSASWRQRGAAR